MSDKHWQSKLFESITAILVTAVVARVVWELLAPLVPLLVVLVILTFIFLRMFGGSSRW